MKFIQFQLQLLELFLINSKSDASEILNSERHRVFLDVLDNFKGTKINSHHNNSSIHAFGYIHSLNKTEDSCISIGSQ